jgi:hypothetical protein
VLLWADLSKVSSSKQSSQTRHEELIAVPGKTRRRRMTALNILWNWRGGQPVSSA